MRAPQVAERGVAHDDRGIHAHAVRSEGGYAPGALYVRLVVRAGQARHHLQDEPEARGLHGPRGILHILRRMAPAREGQDALRHGLRPQLHGLDAEAAQAGQDGGVYGIRPR